MRAAVYQSPSDDVNALLAAMAAGLERSGHSVSRFRDGPERFADIAVVWGWRIGRRIKQEGFTGPVLVMERGYLGDRLKVWTSLGWDGLNGRARFPEVDDPTRFEKHFAADLKPWREGDGYALLVGQVRTDTAVEGTNIIAWYSKAASELREGGWDVVFRQHPREVQRGMGAITVPGTTYSTATLDDDLAGAALAVTFNSNTGVDAIMAGVPVYAEDEGSMVWPIASHDGEIVTPDRRPHLNRLAWCQWQVEELADGSAWEVVREAM